MENKLTREDVEKEIVGSRAALQGHQKGVLVHEIVIKAFEKELRKYPQKKTAKEVVVDKAVKQFKQPLKNAK